MDSKDKATDNVVTQQQDGQEENPSNNNNSGSNNNNNGLSSEPAETRSNSQENQSRTRTPFTNLSQIDADLALARTLQEQERAYMMLMMNQEGSDYGSWEAGSYFHDDEDDFGDPHDASDADDHDEDEFDGTEVDYDDEPDAFDVHAHDDASDENGPVIEYDEGAFSSDEAYARALQDAEEREMAARLFSLAGINERHVEEPEEEHGANSQDAWEEVDPDELSYEELLALGEVVGTESRGLSTDTIASLPTVTYKAGSSQNDNNDSCVICRLDYEDDETLTVLSCKHSYHSECISNWLKINKVCPVCSTEVSTSGHS